MIRTLTFAASAAVLTASVPASAMTNFASYSPLTNAANLIFTPGANGTGTVTSVAGAPVTFRFLNAAGTQSVFDTAATFALSTTTQPGAIFGSTAIASTNAGTISFTALNPVSYLGHTGTNLLTAVFSGATFAATIGGSVASLFTSQPPSMVTFTSDFLRFGGTTERDISIAIDAINPKVGVGRNGLGSFSGSSAGLFGALGGSGSPSAVPEPAAWLLMVAGFGLVGTMRRRATASVAA